MAKGYPARPDLVGQVFGKLTVQSFVEVRQKKAYWRCSCECGGFATTSTGSLRKGNTTSCGCSVITKAHKIGSKNIRHGHYKGGQASPEMRCWLSMRDRCTNPNSSSWEDYGGRGIKVCAQWLGTSGFEEFLKDVGFRPSPTHSLDRYPDKNGHYESGNVRWATKKEQTDNRRRFAVINKFSDQELLEELERRGYGPLKKAMVN